MSELTEPNNDIKSLPENSCHLTTPFTPNQAELTFASQLPVKKSTSIKLNRKTGGIFNNPVKTGRSVSNINQQQALQASKRRPKTISTINDKFISDKLVTTKTYTERKLLANPLSKCNSVVSLCSAGSFLHKPGTIPSYLKGDSKSSIESEFFTKFRKFKSEKKKLHEQQVYFKKEYNDLKRLKQKLMNLGGKELKLDEIQFIDLDGDGASKMPLKCEGTAIELAKKDIDISLMNNIEAQICQIREGDLALRNQFLKASSDILENLNRIQDEDVKQKCVKTLKYFEDHSEKFKSVETETKELLSQNLIRLKKDFIDAATESSVSKMLNDQRNKILDYQIDNSQLKKQVDDLGKKLKQSEQHVKAQEALKRDMEINKEMTQKQTEEHLAEIEKLKTKLKTAKLVEDKLKKDVDNLRSDVTSYESELTNLRVEINSCKGQLMVSDQKCFDLSEKLRSYESKCVHLEDQLEVASTETMHENRRLWKQIEELQTNLKQRDNKLTSLQHMFKSQDAENVTKEFNEAMDGIKQLRGSTFDSYKLDYLKDELSYRCVELTNQEETFSSIQKLLVIRDNLLASMRNE